MAVDLGDLIETLKREVAAPGAEETTFPDATEDIWLGNLQDAFWDARLDGMLKDFTESDGLVTPITGTTDITRDLQQLVVLYAGIRIVRNSLRALNTVFRAKAGPVEFETQNSASVLKSLLDMLMERRHGVLLRLSDLGQVPSYYIDAVYGRELAISYGDTHWVGAGDDYSRYLGGSFGGY